MATAVGRLLAQLREPPALVSGPRKVRVGAIPWPGPIQEQFLPGARRSPPPLPGASSHPEAWRRGLPSPTHTVLPVPGPSRWGAGRGPSGQREEATSSVVLCGAHSSGPAAGRGHVVTSDIPSWPVPRPARAEQASLGRWLQTSDCLLLVRGGPWGIRSGEGAGQLGTWPRGSGPRSPASPPPHLPNNPVTADVPTSSGWKDPAQPRRPRPSHRGWVGGTQLRRRDGGGDSHDIAVLGPTFCRVPCN